ncbi:hypothetical protein SCLCIDRAFT_1219830 [Scleroderma citrinum Foug A]|uniref:Uncharacterized protein n=1 Tax=Scleroderma citrinum Foug A TaxID=1036808 RepID=A0A0C3DL41_9AGAM|nr:hypothetical protein SCLCIDRAFT_1219830 [Scleroderma citrinum Foug A]
MAPASWFHPVDVSTKNLTPSPSLTNVFGKSVMPSSTGRLCEHGKHLRHSPL